MKLFFLLICTFLIIGMSIMQAKAITIPSDKGIPEVSSVLKDMHSLEKGTTTESMTSKSSGDRVVERIISPALSGETIQIKKMLFPNFDNEYVVGDVAAVFVEIKCLGRDLKNMHIKEFVGKGVEIINTSKNCYRLLDLDEISGYGCGANENYFSDLDDSSAPKCKTIDYNDIYDITLQKGACLYDWKKPETVYKIQEYLSKNFYKGEISHLKLNDTTLTFHGKDGIRQNVTINTDQNGKCVTIKIKNQTIKFIDDFNSLYALDNQFDINIKDVPSKRDRIVYWYYILFKKPGIYNSNTIVRLGGDEFNENPDYDYPLSIKVREPQPTVLLKANKTNFLKNEEIKIIYDINFKRYANNVAIRLDDSNTYYKYINRSSVDSYDHNLTFPANFSNESFHLIIEKLISYPNDGEYYLPGIWINNELHSFQNEKVSVETRFNRYINLISLFFAVALFMLGDFFSRFQTNNTKGNTENNKKSSNKNNIKLTAFIKPLPSPVIRKKRDNWIRNNRFNILFYALCILLLICIYWFYIDRPLLILP